LYGANGARLAELLPELRRKGGGRMINALSHFITFCAGGAVGILAFCLLYASKDS
jgi:hypothetical protein